MYPTASYTLSLSETLSMVPSSPILCRLGERRDAHIDWPGLVTTSSCFSKDLKMLQSASKEVLQISLFQCILNILSNRSEKTMSICGMITFRRGNDWNSFGIQSVFCGIFAPQSLEAAFGFEVFEEMINLFCYFFQLVISIFAV